MKTGFLAGVCLLFFFFPYFQSEYPQKPKVSVPAASAEPVVGTVKHQADSGLSSPPSPPKNVSPDKTPPASATKPGAGQTGKTVYLTFDDGPSPLTPRILDILKANQVKATFFVIGSNIKGREGILKRELAEGHVIGGHTWSHNYTTIYKTTNAFFADLEKGNREIEKVTGEKVTLIRFPGGSNNGVSKKAQDHELYHNGKWIMNDLVHEAVDKGYYYYDWNVSSGDAEGPSYTAAQALANVKRGIGSKKNVVLLSHDASTKSGTVQALPEIISYLKKQGFSFQVLSPQARPVWFLKADQKVKK